MTPLSFGVALVAFVILGPLLGCFLTGADRIITARMQGRVGPPFLQPYYDVRKLLAKERRSLNSFQGYYLILALIMTILSGAFFFAGGNILLVVFLISLSSLFFIIAAYSTRSPYAEVGAGREIIQVLAYEPMIILLGVFFFLITDSFDTSAVASLELPLVVALPLVFAGLLFILTIKLRKSPFDLSFSHHAHQELVKGITTEMSGRSLAVVEITHWYENVLFLGYVGLFFVWAPPSTLILAVVVALAVYFLEIVIDNSFARVKWQFMLSWSWIVSLLCSALSLVLLAVLNGFVV
ncbi:MAG: NADH-quinone oxidoreductase subunit H [Coriobacteriales bacterium]|jgi:formate hydrogenlyase subunit 4|nr:NADH-quinone oxidoreductase subunit H [Coriobacteriales bacterium]